MPLKRKKDSDKLEDILILQTYEIHIQGIVQGVGFRPFVYKLAIEQERVGWVKNTINGVYIVINAVNHPDAKIFLDRVIENAPSQSKITKTNICQIDFEEFLCFSILPSDDIGAPNLLLTPDFAICTACRTELRDDSNRRNQYPYITCTNCGPRYSITKNLPYDRETTTMDKFNMCHACKNEYGNPLNRRYYSQTNSCPHCRIRLSLYKKSQLIDDDFLDFKSIAIAWEQGGIIAIKSMGGFLLTCDATQPEAIARLRVLKKRPSKPFAVMYPNLKIVRQHIDILKFQEDILTSSTAPIVILNTKKGIKNSLAMNEIAPHLNKIGVMLPSTGLFEILLNIFNRPIVATSGNPSNSTIVYENKRGLNVLTSIADLVLMDNRDLVVPQDDSVMAFSGLNKQPILFRRSRGLAPSYFQENLDLGRHTVLAMGAMMKSSFSIYHNKNIFISQYLGDTSSFEAENNYKGVLHHFNQLLRPNYEYILVDKHPNYFSTQYGKSIGSKKGIRVVEIQHHKAHFYAVLAENRLINLKSKVLGVIWDGIGLGDDGHIWGGEFFEYQNNKVTRLTHLPYFDFFLGDKMSKEPRISALALMHDMPDKDFFLKSRFSAQEWKIYSKLLESEHLQTSSMGRLFDAIAAIVIKIDKQTYEGEAAMLLEQKAAYYFRQNIPLLADSYLENDCIPADFLLFLFKKIGLDLKNGISADFIAAKFHITMVHYLKIIAIKNQFTKIAFSGGVFQNTCLVDLVITFMKADFDLYFHKELSPNDENISFGQLIYFHSEIKPN